MKTLATALGALVAALGLIGAFWPDGLLLAGRELSTPRGIYVAAALRIAFGSSLLLSAAHSHAPIALRVLGAFVLIAGFATLVLGSARAVELLKMVSHWDELWLRFAAALGFGLGLFVMWALSPRAAPPRR